MSMFLAAAKAVEGPATHPHVDELIELLLLFATWLILGGWQQPLQAIDVHLQTTGQSSLRVPGARFASPELASTSEQIRTQQQIQAGKIKVQPSNQGKESARVPGSALSSICAA